MKRLTIIVYIILSVSNVCALDVSIKTEVKGGDKPVVDGKTNLPNDTDLMVSIKRKESSYGGQAKIKVAGGQFHAGPFTQKGLPFNPGIYALTITVPFAPTQPSSVQTIIGEHGEKMLGSLVKKGALGKIVEYRTVFKIAGAVSVDKDKQARQHDIKDKHEWWLKNCKDICNTSQIQYGQKTGNMYDFDWDRCYNKCLTNERKK
ncbi:MAG: hypothetical protein HXX11_15155 [Desulfuromonadales bacterium]|nr:hypothetical protein [Desulfuromonadales bacterium]